MAENKYKRNYLSKVIARIDFLNPLSSIQDSIPTSITSTCTKYFSIPEPKSATKLFEISFGTEDKDRQKKTEDKFTDWHFYDKKRDNHLLINQRFMSVECTKYQSWEEFSSQFLAICDALFDNSKDLQVNRIGLRFINNIEVAGSNYLSWSRYLDKNLLCIFKVPKDKSKICRAFSNLELNFGDYNIRFQYGMDNPDYPAVIRKKIFNLDYDAYMRGTLLKNDVHSITDKLHTEIVQLFESSITDKLRGIMNAT